MGTSIISNNKDYHEVCRWIGISMLMVLLSACVTTKSPVDSYHSYQEKNVQVDGISINYIESKSKGKPVILVHGNSSSSSVFKKQFNSWFGKKYHLVALDLPGHGKSSKAPQLSDYSLPGYAKKLVQLAEHLDMENAIFVGWSLGGHIVLESVKLLPEASGFVIFGTPPLTIPPDMAAAFLPAPSFGIGFKADINPEEARLFANDFFVPGAGVDLKPFVDDILATDGNARAGLAASISPNYPYDMAMDEVNVVATMQKPLAIFQGEQEQLINPLYFQTLKIPTLWRGKVQIIATSGHTPHWEQPKLFNLMLDAFISEVVTD